MAGVAEDSRKQSLQQTGYRWVGACQIVIAREAGFDTQLLLLQKAFQ